MTAKLAQLAVLAVALLSGCGAGNSDSVPFRCGNQYAANAVVLRGASDVANNQNLEKVMGPLVICELEATASLPNLVFAETVQVLGRSPGFVSFPKLTETTSFEVDGDGVQVEVPVLTTVGKFSVLDNLNGIWSLDMPLLTSLDTLSVSLGSQARLSIPLLQSASFLQIFGYLHAPSLREVGQLYADVELQEGVDVLPALETVDVALGLRFDGAATATVTLPNLVSARDFAIRGGAGGHLSLPLLADVDKLAVVMMPELEDVDMPNVQALEKLTLTDNPKLSGCVVRDLIAQTQPSTTSIDNNGPACP